MKDDVIVEGTQATYSDYETERNKPIPNQLHSKIQLELGFLLKLNYNDQFDFYSELTLDSEPASTPDLCIFPKNKKDIDWKDVEAKFKEIPTTTIEIVSPSQSMNQMAKKVWDIYFPMGVQSAWLINPPPFKTVYILTPDGNQLVFDSGILKDPVTNIEVDLKKVFSGMK